MATATGTSTSLKNFSDSFLAFAVANTGFTDAGTVAMTAGGGDVDAHSVTKSGVTFVFVTAQASEFITNSVQRMEMRMCYAAPVAATAWTVSNPVGQQGLTQMGVFGAGLTFSSPHWFFTDGVACHAVLEIFPNVFSHLSFGQLEKYGAYTGGEYITSTYFFAKSGTTPFPYLQSLSNHMPFAESNNGTNTGYVRYAQGGNDEDDFAPMGTATNTLASGFFQNSKGIVHYNDANLGPGAGSGIVGSLFVNSPSAFNLRAMLIPIRFLLRDTTTTTLQYHPAGCVGGVRLVNIKELDPEAVIDNNWQVFPLAQKIGDATVATVTANLGLAYDTTV